MTPDRFRACLDALSWSGRGLAALLSMDERQVRRWASGQYAIPDWFDTLARFTNHTRRRFAPMRLKPMGLGETTGLRRDDWA
jgi:hypothetical protein